MEYSGRIKFAILNMDENNLVASQNRVTGTPTLFFYQWGRLADRVVGASPKAEIAKHLEAILGQGRQAGTM